MRNADAPKPLIESTSVSAPCSRSAGASAAMSHATPVDVSLCVSSTPEISRRESASKRARNAAGSTAAPGAVSNGSTTQPYVLAISAKRFPNEPTAHESSRSPGERKLATAASSAPVPELPSRSTSPPVPKAGRSASSMRASIAANSWSR